MWRAIAVIENLLVEKFNSKQKEEQKINLKQQTEVKTTLKYRRFYDRLFGDDFE